NAGGGGNMVKVVRPAAITSTTATSQPGALDIFTAGFGTDTSRILGPVTFIGQAADNDFAYYYEFLNPNPQTYTVRSQPVPGTPLIALAVEGARAAPGYYAN